MGNVLEIFDQRSKGSPPVKKKYFLSGIAQITSLPPGNLYHFFLDVKNAVLARITEPSNDDYDNKI